jgi:hypothetical protein
MTLENHHEWVNRAATDLMYGGDALWRAMCSEYAQSIPFDEVRYLVHQIEDALPS